MVQVRDAASAQVVHVDSDAVRGPFAGAGRHSVEVTAGSGVDGGDEPALGEWSLREGIAVATGRPPDPPADVAAVARQFAAGLAAGSADVRTVPFALTGRGGLDAGFSIR